MPSPPANAIDCAVIIALPEEFEVKPGVPSFTDIFRCQPADTFGVEHFRPFIFTDRTNTERRGIVTVLYGMGPARSLDITKQVIGHFDPVLVVNIGIAGALSDDVRLGDMIVADFADHYSYRAKSNDDLGVRFGGKPFNSFYPYFNATQQLRIARPDEFWGWQQYSSDMLGRAISAPIQETLVRSNLINRYPTIKGGPLACGDTVVVSEELRNALLDHNRTFLAVDMESSGVLQGCLEQDREYHRLILKAVTDFADERKADLDGIDSGAIRAWAISNAYVLLHLILKELIDFTRPQIPRPSILVGHTEQSAMSDAIHAGVREHSLKKSYRNIGLDPARLDRLDTIFRIISQSAILRPQQGVIAPVAEWITASTHEWPLAIEGRPGAGKSSFLNALYLRLRSLHESDRIRPIPFYIDLKDYDRFPYTGGRPEAIRQCRSDTDLFLTLAERYPNQRGVILIDGLREYVLADDALETDLLTRVGRYPNVSRVLSFGRTFIPDKPRFRRDLSSYEVFHESLTLGALDPTSPDASAFCEALQHELSGSPSQFLQSKALSLANDLGFEELDFFILALLLERMARPGYSSLKTRSEWLRRYCTEYLTATRAPISAAAKLAFEYAISAKPFEQHTHIGSVPWKLLHRHRTVKDYLVASHVIDVMRDVGRGERRNADDLNYVYPFRINTFCKEIANETRDNQFEVLRGVKELYKRGGPNGKPHACYLAGRLANYQVREEAKMFLAECNRATCEQLQAGVVKSPADLLLARTVYISLMYLGDDKAVDEYLFWLMHDERWDDLNRGFHLEYYGDIPFDPERQMLHSDPMTRAAEIVPCDKTLTQLMTRISKHNGDRDYKMFNVEVYTAYSLAQHRHAKNVLPSKYREALLKLLPEVVSNPNVGKCKPLKQYLAMIEQNFSDATFPIGRLAERLYHIKTEERRGWRKRTDTISRVESVADHIYCAYVLALLYLPEVHAEWIDYQKKRVLDMILVHDLAEAIAGDTAVEDRDDARVDDERRAGEYISACGTYLNVADLDFVSEYLEEFERGANLNARIARDVDLVENLMQLFLYRGHLSERDFDHWYEWIADRVQTDAGHQLFDIVIENFRTRPARRL